MKRLVILITIFFYAVNAKAQFGVGSAGPSTVGRISGTVIDSLTKQPLDYATVGLYRSTGKSPITGVVTDEKGNFKLDNVRPGAYRLEISFIGYPTKVVNGVETTLSKPDKNVGTVWLAPSAKTLKEVTIEGTKSIVENKIDKIVYNAEKDLTAAGGNATDVLQKVPLVAVDINGNVSIRGDGNVRVLINGKPSGATSASLSDVLKTIPADQIKAVEVVTSPSAKYDAEGSAGIINIVTKQKNISGFSGSVSGGVGIRQNNGNMNLNYNQNRFSLSANLGGNLTWPQTSNTTFMQSVNRPAVGTTPAQNYTQSSAGYSRVKRHGALGSITAGYDINSYNSITSTIRLNDGGFNPTGATNTTLIDNIAGTTSAYMLSNAATNKFSGFDWSADYTHKFKKEGHELTFSTQWSHSIIKTTMLNTYTGSSPYGNQQSFNDGKNNEYTLQADYTLPVSKVVKFEAGGKAIIRRINSDYDNYVPATPGGTDFTYDPTLSNLYNYNQNVVAGYTVFTFTLPKSYTLLAGSRLENTAIDGMPTNDLQPDLQPFSNSYFTYIPSLTIQKALSPTKTLKLSYSKRITRPSLTYLNPFLNRANPQSQTQGNPELAPEVTQTVELNYNMFVGSSLFNLSTYYKYTNGLIEGIANPLGLDDLGNGQRGTLTTYSNIGTNKSFGANFFTSVTPFKMLTMRANINAYTYKPTAIGANTIDQSQLGTYIQYNAFLSATFTFKHDILAEAFVLQNSARRTIQGTNPSFNLLIFSVKKQFMNKKMSLGVNAFSPFKEVQNFNTSTKGNGFTQASTFAFPFRSFGVNFSYSFGKLNFSSAKKKGVKNDDLKQDDQGMGGGGAAGGGAQGGGQQ